MSNKEKGILYLVATPIGNLADFSFRAVSVLKSVDLIACEDTRHSRPLLNRYDIDKTLISFHEHNEDVTAKKLIERMLQGESIALISDAGTPLINDPGFPLVKQAIEQAIKIIPIPGACALITALSASGLAVDRFSFEGFPPRTSQARRQTLAQLLDDTRTLIFYESSHRIVEFAQDIAQIIPAERTVVIARELTKLFETIVSTTAKQLPDLILSDETMQKGEFVVLIQGHQAIDSKDELTHEQTRILKLLLEENSVKSAASLAAKITGCRKEIAYREALKLKEN